MTTTRTVTIMFTDVVGSSSMKIGRGDVTAHQHMQAHSELVRREVEQHKGREVKTDGDSFMIEFDSARNAVECAVAVQKGLNEQNRRHPGQEVHIRIGINTGEAIAEGGDFFGAAVDAASRIQSKATPDQILVSEVVRGVVGSAKHIDFVDKGRFKLKGFPERWRIYEVCWQAEPLEPAPLVLTFLFTDVVGSGDITERIGDDRWIDILRAHNAIVRAELAAHEATWSKSLGDGFMAAFAGPIDALTCAISIQRDFAEYNDEHPEEPLHVKFGLHTGAAVREADDFYGRAVNVAARITGQAKGGEILVSSRLKDIAEETAEGAGELAFDEEREVKLRGVLEPVHIWAVRERM